MVAKSHILVKLLPIDFSNQPSNDNCPIPKTEINVTIIDLNRWLLNCIKLDDQSKTLGVNMVYDKWLFINGYPTIVDIYH